MSKGNLLITKNRMGGAESIFSISKSLELISSSKFRILKKNEESFFKMREIALDFFRSVPLNLSGKEITIAIASDNSLCGSYNNNIFRNVKSERNLIAIGSKLQKMLQNANISFVKDISFVELASKVLSQEIGSIKVIYTKYENSKVEVVKENILPLEYSKKEAIKEYSLANSLSLYLEMIIGSISKVSELSEHFSRMISMRNASKNSEDLICELKKKYNKERQYLITKDMMEIVGGMNE